MAEKKLRRVLIVEDDENLRLTLSDNLEIEGLYQVRSAGSIEEAKLQLKDVELIILDIMLPDGDGFSFCQWLRQQGQGCPVLMLTARTLDRDIDSGFESGADDYLAKPYRMRELLLRVQALLRRSPQAQPLVELNGFHISWDARRVSDSRGDSVHLTKKEFDLLSFLFANVERAVSREEILQAVWGENVHVENRTVDNFILALKKQLNLKDGPYTIKSIRGVGYCLSRTLP